MKAGRLTEEIRIERATNTVSDAGTPVAAWTALCVLRAEKVEETSTEYIRNAGARDEDVVVFRARFFDGITNADRVIWRGTVFNIRQLLPIDRRRGIGLRCVGVTP